MEYDQIRVQVLGNDPLPNLRQTYSYVQQEESKRSAMIHSMSVDKTRLVANSSREQSHGSSDKDQLHCDYYGKNRHTKEHYWKLHRRPTKRREGKRMGLTRPQANVSEAVNLSEDTTTTEMFSNEEVQTLRRLLSQLESQSTTVASSNFVNSGIDDRENDWQW
ncbi:hypothetical protein P3X46_014579 [Hevea brasiliensis]|uniref:Uncharacterized protein n=1 Tax=Hevea brasiliensis TaxID=3981 RepID=A0ABQ9LT49_HEVBR|nr:hypothetical protein P3X46_014579 [Hevea brasiliensis]